jgi:hypothetical protein
MSNDLPPITDWGKFRDQIEYQDNLLNERVNFLLVFNGLGAAAFSFFNDQLGRAFIMLAVIMINILLTFCTIQTAFLIKNLTTEYRCNAHDPIDMRVRSNLGWLPGICRPTPILGIYLPVAIIVAWVIGLVVLYKTPAS